MPHNILTSVETLIEAFRTPVQAGGSKRAPEARVLQASAPRARSTPSAKLGIKERKYPMSKKLITALLALVAFAAFALPAVASAANKPVITHPTGTAMAVHPAG